MMDEMETARAGDQNCDPGVWQCLACSKPSNSIHVLPCQHKFCAKCLRLWAMLYVDMYHDVGKDFPCQICWKQYAMPAQGLQAFEQDYSVNVLERSLKHMSVNQPDTTDRQQLQHHLQTPPGQDLHEQQHGYAFPSMLSHMVAPAALETEMAGNAKSAAPDYCVRSRHMYLHMM